MGCSSGRRRSRGFGWVSRSDPDGHDNLFPVADTTTLDYIMKNTGGMCDVVSRRFAQCTRDYGSDNEVCGFYHETLSKYCRGRDNLLPVADTTTLDHIMKNSRGMCDVVSRRFAQCTRDYGSDHEVCGFYHKTISKYCRGHDNLFPVADTTTLDYIMKNTGGMCDVVSRRFAQCTRDYGSDNEVCGFYHETLSKYCRGRDNLLPVADTTTLDHIMKNSRGMCDVVSRRFAQCAKQYGSDHQVCGFYRDTLSQYCGGSDNIVKDGKVQNRARFS